MKTPLSIFILVLIAASLTAQTSMKKVKTTGVFDTASYKSGRMINDYYVEISDKDFEKYKGKKVEVSGKLLVISGIDPNDKVIVQGSTEERKFITTPKIRILKESDDKK